MSSFALSKEYNQLFSNISRNLCSLTSRFDGKEHPANIRPEENSELRKLKDRQFKYIGKGISRVVFRFPEVSSNADKVVKLSRFGISPINVGFVQNKREYDLYESYGGDYPLCPVVCHQENHFRWLVMEYADPVHDDPKNEPDDPLVKEYERYITNKLSELHEFNTIEVEPRNIGLRAGDPYLIDYGRPSNQ